MHEGKDGKSETEPGGRRTSQLLRALAGLRVTESALKNQVHRGYLMPPGDDVWSPAAVARAKRCFRLRHRGAKGMVLKMLLFVADGYGWEDIRKDSIEGFTRVTALSLLGVDVYAKNGRSLDSCIPDIVSYQDDAMSRRLGPDSVIRPTSETTTRFSVGLLHRGEPLEGGSGRRLMGPLLRMMHPRTPDLWVGIFCSAFDVISGLLGLSLPQQISRLENATPRQIETARLSLVENLQLIRRIGRKAAGAAGRGQSFNLLTCFGHAGEMDYSPFSVNGINITPKFMLGGCVGGFLPISIALRDFVASWERLLPSLLILTKQFFRKTGVPKTAT
jgi:hypothetical protein